MKKFTLQQNIWQGFEPVEIELPDYWDVEFHGIKADTLPALSREEIAARIANPYGMKPLRELAAGRERVCVVFDDISRGTPTQILAEIVLTELHRAGIRKEQIRFICALGCHGAHSRRDFVQKLGEEIVSNYAVWNHNCYENNVQIGTTKRGYPVLINKEFMSCDLKIGLGGILPHIFNSFGGGGKILFPGMAAIDTIEKNHEAAINYIVEHKTAPTELVGDLRADGMRKEVEEMTRMVGEFFKVDALFNTKQEIVDLYAGDPIEEYYAAIPKAQEIYVSARPRDKELVIVNANARANEAGIAMSMAGMGLAPSGGDVVLVNFTSLGQCVHYLLGTFGENAAGRMHGFVRPNERLRRLICYTPYRDSNSAAFYGEVGKQIYVNTWQAALELLKNHGPGTRVSVLPDGTMQYFSK